MRKVRTYTIKKNRSISYFRDNCIWQRSGMFTKAEGYIIKSNSGFKLISSLNVHVLNFLIFLFKIIISIVVNFPNVRKVYLD